MVLKRLLLVCRCFIKENVQLLMAAKLVISFPAVDVARIDQWDLGKCDGTLFGVDRRTERLVDCCFETVSVEIRALLNIFFLVYGQGDGTCVLFHMPNRSFSGYSTR